MGHLIRVLGTELEDQLERLLGQPVGARSRPIPPVSSSSQLSLQTRALEDPSFADRISLLSSARRAGLALRYHRGVPCAVVARSHVTSVVPADHLFSMGGQVFYWRGPTKRRRDWAQRWLGPGAVIGHEQDSLWISHRNTMVKCAPRHVRFTGPEERLPWSRVLDEVTIQMGADERPNLPRDDTFLELTANDRPVTVTSGGW